MGRTYFLALCISLSFSSLAFAGLGFDEKSCSDEEKFFSAKSHEITNVKNYRVHILKLNDGMIIREHVTGGGVVFGVCWSGTGYHPKFDKLFGKHFAEFQAHKNEMPHRRSHPFNHLETANMVVEMGGHPMSLSGCAYIPALLPAGVTPGDIQ